MDTAKKKIELPKWVKWATRLGFGLAFLLFVLGSCMYLITPKPEIKSLEEWKQHKEFIESFSNHIMVYKTATQIYVTANDYYKDGFYGRCDLNLGGCAEYKAFVRTARDATADGVLTPQEMVEVSQSYVILKQAIAAKDLEYKKKFGK